MNWSLGVLAFLFIGLVLLLFEIFIPGAKSNPSEMVIASIIQGLQYFGVCGSFFGILLMNAVGLIVKRKAQMFND